MPSSLPTQLTSMEPLLPEARQHELAELTMEITRRSQALAHLIPAALPRQRIAALVQGMNSYYSNLIEGHKTYPRDLEQALRDDFSADPERRANQHLARAHIAVEQLMRARLSQEPELGIHSPEFIGWLHREFYQHLPEELRIGQRRDGTPYPIPVGTFRSFEVDVGGHQPPHHGALPAFMDRFNQFYSQRSILATNQLVALAAGHHRLAWIHPFGDGNGRVARLHSQAWLIRCQADSGGLWTLSRGLARHKDEYYQHLAAADQGRQGDYDGRGNLSDKTLADFCLFLMRTMLDQINFMAGLLDLPTLADRMESHVLLTYPDWSLKERQHISRMLKAALMEGELDRGAATRLVGVSPATGTKLIRKALDAGLLSAASPKGALSLVFDSQVLETYFPRLYQDLPG